MEKQAEIDIKKVRYFIKGSGNTYCLLNDSDQDQNNFIEYNFLDFINSQNKLSVKDFSMTGLYLIALCSNGQIYILGKFGQKIIKKPYLCIFNLNIKIKIVQIKSGWQHSVLKSQNEILYGLGSNKFQQLGFQNNQKFVYQPQQLILPDKNGKINSFQCGFRQTYYFRNNRVFGCGQSKKYELGLQNCKSTSWVEIQMKSQKKQLNFIKISCSKKAAFFISDQNELYALGWNEHNIFNIQKQIKQKKQLIQYLSKITKINQNVKDVQCGWSHVVLVKSKVKVKVGQQNDTKQFYLQSYGRNNFSQLGRKTVEQNNIKTIVFQSQRKKLKQFYQFTTFQKQPKICCGTEFTFCINGQGTHLYGWGWNQHHNIIQNQEQKFIKRPIQVPIHKKNSKKQKNHKYEQSIILLKRVWTYPAITLVEVECQILQNKK